MASVGLYCFSVHFQKQNTVNETRCFVKSQIPASSSHSLKDFLDMRIVLPIRSTLKYPLPVSWYAEARLIFSMAEISATEYVADEIGWTH